MCLDRESQISSITRASVLFLFGLTCVSSGADRLTCTTPCIISAVPFLVRSTSDQVRDSYLRRAWPAQQVGRGAVEMLLRCDNGGAPVGAPWARRDAGREGAAEGRDETPSHVMDYGRPGCPFCAWVSEQELDESRSHGVVSLALGRDWRRGNRASTFEPHRGSCVAGSLV